MPWKPGQSGNRAGRPKGFAGVSRRIMQETRDGDELVEWALSVWRDSSRPYAERAAAHGWLSDRGLGRPVQTTELHATLAPGVPEDDEPDLSHLSVEQLRELAELERRRDELLASATADEPETRLALPGAHE